MCCMVKIKDHEMLYIIHYKIKAIWWFPNMQIMRKLEIVLMRSQAQQIPEVSHYFVLHVLWSHFYYVNNTLR